MEKKRKDRNIENRFSAGKMPKKRTNKIDSETYKNK